MAATQEAGSASDIERTAVAHLVGLTLGLLGALAVSGTVVWAMRTGRYIEKWQSIATPLTRSERLDARRQIIGRSRVDAARLPVLVPLARQYRAASEGTVPFCLGMATACGGGALIAGLAFAVYLTVVAALFLGVAVWSVAFISRPAGAFLREHR